MTMMVPFLHEMIGLRKKRRGRECGKANVEVKKGGNGANTIASKIRHPQRLGSQCLIRGKESGGRNMAAHVNLYFQHLQNTFFLTTDF